MGPKKKGKGSKLARMSDEERARYLQHRAAIEEEARRRKEQLIETFMKNKLKKEEAFSRLNVAKINQQWRQTLRVLKCAELKQDFEALFHLFDHTANKKTQLIECLLGDLQEAENQYSRIHQCHMETVDKLLKIYNGRISTLQGAFEEERDEMFALARSDAEDLVECAAAEQDHLHAIVFRMEETLDDATTRVLAVHNVRTDELRNHMLTELENLVNCREARMEKLWGSFQAVLQEHWSQTEDRRREYLNLRDADADNCNHIFQYHQQISALNDVLSNLKKQLGSANSEGYERVVERKSDKVSCLELFHVLRQKLNIEKDVDRKKLCFMTDAAQSVTKDLGRTLGKGQQILQLMTLCKKLETPSEKICPGGLFKSPLTEEAEKSVQESQTSFEEPLAEVVYKKFSKLDGFWRRYNRVLIEKESLTLEQQALMNEQRRLKSILKQYFTEFSETQALPKAPLSIHRPMSFAQGSRRPMALKGEKVIPRSGKIDICTELIHTPHHTPSFMHMLTIQLTKPL